ncbi:MAG: methionyl-tRNA formyltransferase [Candidatus Dormibacteria bacterium]
MATRSAGLAGLRDQLWARPQFSFIPDRDAEPLAGTVSRGGGPPVVFAGFPSDYSLAFLLALLEAEVEVVALLTSPGAHEAILGDNALSRIADHLGIPLLRAWRVNDEHALLDMQALRPAAVVMASFDQIIKGRMLSLPEHGWMNIHPSALPRRRGPEPVYWTIAEGDAVAGITMHRAVPRVDAGPVFAQRTLAVADDDTAGTLTRRLCAIGTEALPGALSRLLGGDEGDPLSLEGATYAPPVGHRHLDAARSMAEALRWVRAGVPNMPAWTEIAGRTVYVRRASPAQQRDGAPLLHLSDGAIRLDDVGAACGCHHNLVECPHRRE